MSKEIADMPIEAYHSSQAIGSSGLKLLQRSPLHYWAAYIDPQREPIDKLAFRVGRAWHCAVFEPEHFDARYASNHDAHPSTNKAKILAQVLAGDVPFSSLVELPEGLKTTTKEGKQLVAEIEAQGNIAVSTADYEWLLEWAQKLSGKDVLSSGQLDTVKLMAASMRSHPISDVLFYRYQGLVEQTFFDIDPQFGVTVKIRPDFMLLPCADFPDGLIVDGKSTTDASADGFAKQVWSYDYGLQAAFYTSVFQRVLKTQGRPQFLWAACEKSSPHASAYYAAGADLLEYWDKKIRQLMRLYANCLNTDTWPGYSTSVQSLELPAWAAKQIGESV